MRRLLFLLLLSIVVSAAAAAPAAGSATVGNETKTLSLAPHVEILEDPGGRLSIDDLRQGTAAGGFVARHGNGDLNLGYSSSAWWLRIRIEAAPAARPDWLLEVAFPTLDDLALFAGDSRTALPAGDLAPFAERTIHHRNFVFPVQLPPGGTQTLLLRVASSGTLTIPLHLWQPEAFAVHTQQSYALHALYYGMLLALGLYNLMLWFSLRDRSYLAYVAFVAAMATGQLAQSGLGYQYLWPTWPAWEAMSFNSGFAATGLFGALFTRIFLNTRHHHPRIDRLLLLLVGGFAFTTLAPLFIPYRIAAIATSLIGVSFATLAVVAGLLRFRRGDPGARFFLLAWAMLLVGVALMGLRNLSLLPTNFLTVNGIQLGSALEMLLLSFALADRVHVLRREKEAAQLQAAEADRQRIELLERTERVLEARVDERTRELEAANFQLSASEARLRTMAHHDPLTGLPNRLLLFDRIAHAIQRAERNGKPFAFLLVDLDGFKSVNDTFGHDAGDQLLIAVAGRMKECVRAADTIARLGGDEFVLLLEDAEDGDAVREVGEKIVSAVRRGIRLEEGEAMIGASVGIAHYPADGSDAQSLLRVADRAMYSAKRLGRNRVMLAGAH